MISSTKLCSAAVLTIFLAWKVHVLLNRIILDSVEFYDFSRSDPSMFNTSSVFRSIDRDCRVNMSPVEPVKERLYMLVLVLSAPANFKQREQTRAQNWAPHNLHRGKIQIVFLLGRVKDQHLQDELEKENSEWGDILQFSVEDGYHNLPYKTIAGFLWSANLPEANKPRYIVKLDDDIRVDTTALVSIMEEKYPEPISPNINTLHCVVLKNMRPTRSSESVNSKFAVSAAEYVRDKYPEYCNGWLYVLHPDMAERIAVAASTTPFLFVDDIFVTGLARERVEGSRLEYLASGRYWRMILEAVSVCPLFNLLYFHFLSGWEVAYAPDNRPIKTMLCVALEHFVGINC